MKQTMFKHKRWLSLLLSMAMIISIMPVSMFTADTAYAEESTPLYAYLTTDSSGTDNAKLVITTDNTGGYASAETKWEGFYTDSNWNQAKYQLWSEAAGQITSVKIGGETPEDVVKPIRMGYWFAGFENLKSVDADGLDVSAVTYAGDFFNGCTSLADFSFTADWKMPELTDATEMFQNCKSMTSIDLSGWNASKIIGTNRMFNGCENLQSVNASNLGGNYIKPGETREKDAGTIKFMTAMFQGCVNLTTITGIEGWDLSIAQNVDNMFRDCKLLTALNLDDWHIARNDLGLYAVSGMFSGCENLETLTLGSVKAARNNMFTAIFQNCSKLTTIDLSNWTFAEPTDYNAIRNLDSLFDGCTSLETIIFPGEPWLTTYDFYSVTMDYTFRNCKSLKKLDFSEVNLSRLNRLQHAFEGCSSLEEVIFGDAPKSFYTNMNYAFADCTSLKRVNFDNWNMGEIEYAFYNCSSLEDLGDMSTWKLSSTYDLSYLFFNCSSLTSEAIAGMKNWNTRSINAMMSTFRGCSSLTELDLSNWSTYGVENRKAGFAAKAISGFASECSNLTKITIGPNFGFDGMPTSGMFALAIDDAQEWDDANYNISNQYMQKDYYKWYLDNRDVYDEGSYGGDGEDADFGDSTLGDLLEDHSDADVDSSFEETEKKITDGEFVLTDILVSGDDDTIDHEQKNYQKTTASGESGGMQSYITESAEWSEYDNGTAKIAIDAATSMGYSSIPLYVFTVCDAHGFEVDIAAKNIAYLAKQYSGYADAMIIAPSGIILGPYRFDDKTDEADIKDKLDNIGFTGAVHYMDSIVPAIRQYIFGNLNGEISAETAKRHPVAIYVSLDNVIRTNGVSTNGKYATEELYRYLAENYEPDGNNADTDRYISLTSEANYESDKYGSPESPKDPGNKHALTEVASYAFSPSNYVNGITDGEADYLYDDDFEDLNITPIAPAMTILTTLSDKFDYNTINILSENCYYGDTKKTPKSVAVNENTGRVTFTLGNYIPGDEIHLELTANVKEQYTAAPDTLNGWFDTNSSATSFRDNTRTLISVQSPKLRRYSNGLTITKTVVAGDDDKDGTKGDFTFTVTLSDARGKELTGISYEYEGISVVNGVDEPDDGTITSGGEVTLKHGQGITITGLPEGAQYTVTEDDPDTAERTYNVTNTDTEEGVTRDLDASGTIDSVTGAAEVDFTNTKIYKLTYHAGEGYPETCEPESTTAPANEDVDVADAE
ncbi:MAG: BspA family leucine-rich repeat surface protein, partial [Oscillospiraceae bacterium]|nr:BspA family leucine-rich repeat surface protein [Oscillospiraceae bacterium]